ncbi:hypothetical protein ECDEC1B_4984 [Escherichia coli DEC1B]|nr:hypothetical protein ECDEC1B_4984 [Escherichia coli DEC1B]
MKTPLYHHSKNRKDAGNLTKNKIYKVCFVVNNGEWLKISFNHFKNMMLFVFLVYWMIDVAG